MPECQHRSKHFCSKNGEQDEKYRSLGKLAYKNMGLGGGGLAYMYIYNIEKHYKFLNLNVVHAFWGKFTYIRFTTTTRFLIKLKNNPDNING